MSRDFFFLMYLSFSQSHVSGRAGGRPLRPQWAPALRGPRADLFSFFGRILAIDRAPLLAIEGSPRLTIEVGNQGRC